MSDRFIATKQHRRFVEFADIIKRNATIGLRPPVQQLGRCRLGVQRPRPARLRQPDVNAAPHRSRSVFYTPAVSDTPKNVAADIKQLLNNADTAIEEHARRQESKPLIITGPTCAR